MEESHKTHRPHIKVGKDEEKKNHNMSQSYDPYWNTHALYGVQVCQHMYQIEMIQNRVLRSIHPGLHYDDISVLVGLQSLNKRRDNLCKAYFNRLKRNTHILNHLIPERRDVHYSIINANVYPSL